jgi:hypothetical protein
MAESIVHKYFGHMTRSTKDSIQSEHGAVRQGGESLLGGLALGAIHARSGLDIKGKVPADVLGAVVLYAASGSAPDSVSTDLRTLANAGMTSFGFRQGYALLAEKQRSQGKVPVGGFTPMHMPGSKIHGEMGQGGFTTDVGEDPIVALAKSL